MSCFSRHSTIVVPAIVSEEVFQLAARRLEANRRFSARRTKQPSLLQGLIACRRCGHALFRATKTSPDRGSWVYYRCAGNNYKRRHGRVCQNRTGEIESLDNKLANEEIYLKLAENLESFLMVKHDPRYASYADRTIHLFDGRIVEESLLRDLDDEAQWA